jgi:hypothetical protein
VSAAREVALTGLEVPPAALARAGVALVHEAALDPDRLAGLGALLISQHADQVALADRSADLEALLGRGGTILLCGQLAYPVLPMLRPFEPLARPSLDALAVGFQTFHPLFAGVDARDLTFRRGVAGFWGRGQNPPPPGARPITTLDGGRTVLDWELALPGGGRLFVHAGNDLWSFDLDGTDSAARLVPNLLAWLGLGPGERRP